MDILAFNIQWMSFNAFLAIVPIFAGILMYKSRIAIIKICAAIIWFLFIPNTIYLLTDPINLLTDVQRISGVYLLIDVIMYLILLPIGVITYIISLNYFERMFVTKKAKQNIPILIYFLNFLIGFGLVLGRILRLNSWEAFTNLEKVISDSLHVLSSIELMIVVVTFAVLCQLVYLKFKAPVLRLIRYN